MVVGGSLSGFLAGLIGTGGALRGAFLTAFGITKLKYFATAAAVGVAVDVTRLPIYIRSGFGRSDILWYIPLLFLIALIGSLSGKAIVDRIPQREFRVTVLWAIFILGVKFVLDWVGK